MTPRLGLTSANPCSTELPDGLDTAAIQHFRTTATPAREVKGLPPPRSGLSTDDPETVRDTLRFVTQHIYCGNEGRLGKICVQCGQLSMTRQFRKEILRVYGKQGVLGKLHVATPFSPSVIRSLRTGEDQ